MVIKRSKKNFTREKWKISLAKKGWEAIGETEDVDKMAEIFNMQVTKALDECAPLKEIKIRRHHKFGLKEDMKKMIKERDSLRKKIGKVSKKDKGKIQEEDKKLLNKIIGKVRKPQWSSMKREQKKQKMRMRPGRLSMTSQNLQQKQDGNWRRTEG